MNEIIANATHEQLYPITDDLDSIIAETIEQHWTDFASQYGSSYRARRRQNSPAQKDIAKLSALGITTINKFGYDDVKALLTALGKGPRTEVNGIEIGSAAWTGRRTESAWTIDSDGEAWTIKLETSKLYDYLTR